MSRPLAAFVRCSVCRGRVADRELQPPVLEASTCVGTEEHPHPPHAMQLVVAGTFAEIAADLDDVIEELREAVHPVVLRVGLPLLAAVSWLVGSRSARWIR